MNDSNHDKKKNKNNPPQVSSQATLPTEAPPATPPAPVAPDAAPPPPATPEKKAYTKADVRGLLEAAYAADDAILAAEASIVAASKRRNDALMAVEAVMGSLGPFNFNGKAISITKRNRKGHKDHPGLEPIYRFAGKEEATPIEI